MARILEVLERHPLFEGIPREDLAPLVMDCRLRTPLKGDRVFTAHEPAAAFFIVGSGRVKLCTFTPGGKEHVVEILQPGESFALMPVLAAGVYPVTAEALSDAALVRVPRESFLRLQARRPELHERAAKEIAERMTRFRQRLEEVTTRSVPARVATHLLRLAAREGPVRVGAVVDLGATREVVAASLGTAREVLIRTLTGMEREGIVALRGRRVEILAPDRLEAAAEE